LSAGRLSGCFTTLQATPTTTDYYGIGVDVTTLRADGQSDQLFCATAMLCRKRVAEAPSVLRTRNGFSGLGSDMGTLNYAARVGIVMLVAIAVFSGVVVFLKGRLFDKTYTIDVVFSDATGVAKDVDVTMAGVKIGSVSNIRLSGLEADLTLSLYKDKRIPAGSRFEIEVPPLSNIGIVAVLPPPGALDSGPFIPQGAKGLGGGQGAGLQQSMDNANVLMEQFQGTIVKLNKLLDQSSALVGDPKMQNGLRQSIVNLQEASQDGLVLTRDLNQVLHEDNSKVAVLLDQVQAKTTAALTNIDATTADVRDLTHNNQGNLNEIIANLRDTTAAVDGITDQTNSMLKNGGITKNLSAVVANLKDSTDKLDVMAGDMEKVMADPDMQSDLKATVHNMRDTTEQTDYMVRRIDHLLGVKEPNPLPETVSPPVKGDAAPASGESAPAPSPPVNGEDSLPTPTPSLKGRETSSVSQSASPPGKGGHNESRAGEMLLVGPRADMMQNTRDNRFRMDLADRVPMGTTGNFVDAGIFGVGDANRLDLEYGTLPVAGYGFDYRLGLHASKLGVGADFDLGHGSAVSADLYNPNNGQLDVHGIIMLNSNIGLLLGSDNIVHRSSAVVGVEIRK
jgi:ABC-type transporter Mla subunit MlaD